MSSSLLPEPPRGADALNPAATQEQIQKDIELGSRLLDTLAKRPERIPQSFIAQMIDLIQVSNLSIPISQVSGFTQFTAQAATRIITNESTTSTTYTTLTTTGPKLSGLPSGSYLLLYGCVAGTATSGQAALMNLKLNSTSPADDDNSVRSGAVVPQSTPGGTAFITDLTSDSNTVEALYRTTSGAASASFNRRWLVAVKYANL